MKGLGKDLAERLHASRVLTSPEDRYAYSTDATFYFARAMPDAVVLPETTEEVARVLRYAEKQRIPVTPRGAGTGLSAGCTPIHGGIVIDLKRMRAILDVNRGNMTATVQCGVVLGDFQRTVEAQSLFYPPDPQSWQVSTIGGNIATRAGGARCVKYGTTPQYVLGLEVVLPDGTVIETGGTCVKQSVGYDLTHLLSGSEGTLGVITRAHLRLLPLPPVRRTATVACETLEQAAALVSEIIAGGVVPARMEFLQTAAIHVMNLFIKPPLDTAGEAYLLIEFDGGAAQVAEDTRRLQALCRQMAVLGTRVIEDASEAATYWEARKNLYPVSLRFFKKVIIEDVTVPRNRLPEYVRKLQGITASTGVVIGIAGHAGDGNLHPTLVFNEVDGKTDRMAQEAVAQLIRAGLDLGGTISGEHGIGLHKAPYLAWDLGVEQIELMKRVKKAFDPRGIMNPGKIWEQGDRDG